MGWVRAFWRSQVGKKVVMAVTGLIGVGFVIGHMVGNLQMFQGPDKMNDYAHFLHHTVGELLWLVRAVLLAAVVLHVLAAYQLSRDRLGARPVGYRKGPQREVSTLASRTIRWGGVLLFAFIVFHILHFTTRSVFPGYSETDVYGNVVRAFRNPLVTLFYVASMIALGLHLYHGAWSSLRSLGASPPSAHPLRRVGATVVAVIVWAGFTAVPIAVLTGLIQPNSSRAAEPAATARRSAPVAPAAGRVIPTAATASTEK
jgi:succinate dehydrogenase / fumarate reductase, cytochrome b subunit